MTNLEQMLVAVAIFWLSILTLALLLVIRQMALLTIRLDQNMRISSVDDDALEIGDDVPTDVGIAIPSVSSGLAYVMLISATCTTCREVALSLRGRQFDKAVTILLTGSTRQADPIADLLPPSVQVIRDPEAARLAGSLAIKSTPFLMEIETLTVTGKSYVRDVADLDALMNHREETDAADIAQMRREARTHAGTTH